MAKKRAGSRDLARKRSSGTKRLKPDQRRTKKKGGTQRAKPTKRISRHARVTGSGRNNPVMGLHQAGSLTAGGSTAHFKVSYSISLGTKGAALAKAILGGCEADYASLQQIFAGLTPGRLPFAVQITDEGGGASHSSCLGTDVHIGGNSSDNVDFIRLLLVAEIDEVFMANFGHGWDCGASTGEGLSRVLANDLYKGATSPDFVSSNRWLNSNPRPNFIDSTDPTDNNFTSIGCAVLFLNWLRFQLNHSWAEIVAAGGATLADTYRSLTGRSAAWDDFNSFMGAHFPNGRQYRLTTDNPFPLATEVA
jgi:hypothetical protein